MDRSAGLLRLSRRLSDRFRVIRYDRRGYGRSTDVGPPFTIDAQHRRSRRARRASATGGDGVRLAFGHSFGGNIALGARAATAGTRRARRRLRDPDVVDRPGGPSETAGGAALGRSRPRRRGGGVHAPAGRRREVGPAPTVDARGAAGRGPGDGGRAGRPPATMRRGTATGSTQPVLATVRRAGARPLIGAAIEMLPVDAARLPARRHRRRRPLRSEHARRRGGGRAADFIGTASWARGQRSAERAAPTEQVARQRRRGGARRQRRACRRSRTRRRAHPLRIDPAAAGERPDGVADGERRAARLGHRLAGQRQRRHEAVLEAEEEHEQADDADGRRGRRRRS